MSTTGTITSTGIASGLDVETLVTKLMAVEKQPLTTLQTKEASYQSKLTAYGSLKSAVSTFQSSLSTLSSASVFQGVSATVADTTIASVTASASAKAGTYSLAVSQLATAQSLSATGQASETASIGTGSITISLGSVSAGVYTSTSTSSITINSSNNSLDGIRDAINNAGLGVTASIINDGTSAPYKLVLKSNDTGSASVMKISASGTELSNIFAYDPTVSTTQKLTQTSEALDAKFTLNGVSITKNSNTVTDAVEGLTLNLSKITTSATSITVAANTALITSAVNAFVSAYNTLTTTLSTATAYDADTKTAAVLNGESTVRTIQVQLRKILNTPVSGGATSYTLLSQVGVSFQKDGTLAVDSTKLATALKSNYSDFAGLFATMGKTTDNQVSYTSATSETKAGTYAVNVTTLATQASLTSSSITSSLPITINSSNKTFTVKLDGNTATVTLNEGIEYASAADLAVAIQSKINGTSIFSNANSSVKVTASSSGELSIVSTRYGSASNVSITGGSAFGFTDGVTNTGTDVVGTINGATATGSGQTLTGATGNASAGLKITITGGVEGASRGTVSYSQGFATKLKDLADNLLDDDGPLAARTDGLTKTIKRLQTDEDTLSTRLTVIEARYRAQFNALETIMANLNTTSSYLTQQITALENLNKQSSS